MTRFIIRVALLHFLVVLIFFCTWSLVYFHQMYNQIHPFNPSFHLIQGMLYLCIKLLFCYTSILQLFQCDMNQFLPCLQFYWFLLSLCDHFVSLKIQMKNIGIITIYIYVRLPLSLMFGSLITDQVLLLLYNNLFVYQHPVCI